MPSANYQIVALANQGNEIQIEDARGRARSDTAIDRPGPDLRGGREMTGRSAIVAMNMAGFDSGRRKGRVQQNAATRALFASHEDDAPLGQIFDEAERLGIAARDNEALLPDSEGDHRHGVAAKQPPDLRGIRFAARHV